MKNKLADFYLEFLNNFLTVERFAEYYDLSILQAQTMINLGKEFHLERTE